MAMWRRGIRPIDPLGFGSLKDLKFRSDGAA